ncbi:MAG: phosphoadenosine phosphosulfate reductase [Leeuwenhoekiella sp.]
MTKKLLIAVSGGRSSALMARHIQQSPKYDCYEKLYVFCNTGQERPETIQFLKDMVTYWGIPLNIVEGKYSIKKGIGVRHKVADFDTLCMDSEPFEGAIMQLNKAKWTGVPNTATPYCSDYLKSRVSHSFAREIFGTTKYIKAIGYRFEDMPKRITLAELSEDKTRIAPLLTDFDQPITQWDLNVYFNNQPFKLGIHSDLGNCRYCWKKYEPNIVKAIQIDIESGHLNTINWYRRMEAKHGNTFFRENKSIDDLVRIAESGVQQEIFADSDFDGCVCNF